MIAHQGLGNCIREAIDNFRISPRDRVLALTSLHHDMSVFDIFGTLGAGGTVVIPDHSERREPARWAELVWSEGITIWNSVPASMEMMLDQLRGRSDLIDSL